MQDTETKQLDTMLNTFTTLTVQDDANSLDKGENKTKPNDTNIATVLGFKPKYLPHEMDDEYFAKISDLIPDIFMNKRVMNNAGAIIHILTVVITSQQKQLQEKDDMISTLIQEKRSLLLERYLANVQFEKQQLKTKQTTYWTYISNVVESKFASVCTNKLQNLVLDTHVPESYVKNPKLSQPLFSMFTILDKIDYIYFGHKIQGNIFTPELLKLKLIAEQIMKDHSGQNIKFDVAFVNLYRSGEDYIPPHKDTTHGIEYPIISFSFYEDCDDTKKDDLRSLIITKDNFDEQYEIIMQHASVVIMEVGMQKLYKHAVLTTKSKKFKINVTFRVSSTL